MSDKTKEENLKLAKDPAAFSYRGDEDLVIKAKDFLELAKAVEIAMQQGTKAHYPTVEKYVAAATGIDVPNPAEEEIKTGAVVPIVDLQGTVSQSNIHIQYEPWLIPDIFEAKQIIYKVHKENVEADRAVPQDELMKEAQERDKARQEAMQRAQGQAQGPGPREELAPEPEEASETDAPEPLDTAPEVTDKKVTPLDD